MKKTHKIKLIKNLSLVVAIAIFIFSCNVENKKASISVYIDDIGNDTILMTLISFDQEPSYLFDTIISKNEEIQFDTLINKLHYGYIITKGMYKNLNNNSPYFIRSKSIEFFLSPNEDLVINGESKEFKTDYKLEGSNLNEQFNIYRKKTIDYYAETVELDYIIENHYIDNSPDSIIDSLIKKQRESSIKKAKEEKAFILNYPNYEYTAFLLNKQRKDTIIKYYPLLTVSAKESEYGQLLEKQIIIWESIKIGAAAPDFEYLTLENDTFKLSDKKGKYVVLDFWGSWCGSCIMGIPKMKEYYSKYSDRMEFVGIACRDTEKKWTRAVEKYNIPWIQILNIENKEKNLVNNYGVEGFPTKIIINKQGIIKEIFLGETDEFYTKMDNLLKE
ncbi:MAG: TlpA disulfide reductase family protein [Bacteroidales bacterium]